MKISCVHTGANAKIFALMESELRNNISIPLTITHITSPEIISRISDQQHIASADVLELLKMYTFCADAGADVILNMCSSVGDIADAMAAPLSMAGTKVIRIDQKMCEVVVAKHNRIAVVATLNSTLRPSCQLVERSAAAINKEVSITPVLVENAFNLNAEDLSSRILQLLAPLSNDFDAVVLAQNSMSACQELLEQQLENKAVYSSPAYAAQHVAEYIATL